MLMRVGKMGGRLKTYWAPNCSFLALMAKLALKSSKCLDFLNRGSLIFLSNKQPHEKFMFSI